VRVRRRELITRPGRGGKVECTYSTPSKTGPERGRRELGRSRSIHQTINDRSGRELPFVISGTTGATPHERLRLIESSDARGYDTVGWSLTTNCKVKSNIREKNGEKVHRVSVQGEFRIRKSPTAMCYEKGHRRHHYAAKAIKSGTLGTLSVRN